VSPELATAPAMDSTTVLVVETDSLVSAPDWRSGPDPPVPEIARRLAALAASEPHEADRSRRWLLLSSSAAPKPPGWR